MRSLAVIALSVFVLNAGSGSGHAEDKKISIEGSYTLVGLQIGGEAIPADLIAKIPDADKVIKITADKIIVSKSGKDDPQSYKLDTSKTPYQMDFVEKKADGKESKSFGICKVDGDKLIICAVESEKAADRPKEFKTTATNKAIVMTLQKKK